MPAITIRFYVVKKDSDGQPPFSAGLDLVQGNDPSDRVHMIDGRRYWLETTEQDGGNYYGDVGAR